MSSEYAKGFVLSTFPSAAALALASRLVSTTNASLCAAPLALFVYFGRLFLIGISSARCHADRDVLALLTEGCVGEGWLK